ncbi:MAG: winged helix-turn-helix domain-containing protein [Saprospiraceae bacterium]
MPTLNPRLTDAPPFRKFAAFGKVVFGKNARLLPLLLVLPVLAWLLLSASEKQPEDFSSEKVNLALRRTADGLLRQAGDSTSRIPAVEHTAAYTWRVRLEQPFDYDALPALLQSSLDVHGIQRPYEVAVRRCADDVIDLGYHKLDITRTAEENADGAACRGREMPEGCHFIEITFLEAGAASSFGAVKTAVLWLLLGGAVGYWFFRRQKQNAVAPAPEPAATAETAWLTFGNSRLDVAGQVLVCGAGDRQTLTFRETKLLRLFAENPDRLLERDFILRQVWADEGVLVGRSVDVFVSRLRKKLAADPSVGLVAVHGVGYRLEVRG